MEYADIVATVALVFSLSAFIWNVVRMERWQKPVVSIQHSAFACNSTMTPDGTVTPESWGMVIDVINVGDIVTNIVDVYWEAEIPGEENVMVYGSAQSPDLVTLELIRAEGVGSGRRNILGEVEPSLPKQLGRNEMASWTFIRWVSAEPLLSKASRVRPVVGYLTRSGLSRHFGHTAYAYDFWRDGPAATRAREELDDADA